MQCSNKEILWDFRLQLGYYRRNYKALLFLRKQLFCAEVCCMENGVGEYKYSQRRHGIFHFLRFKIMSAKFFSNRQNQDATFILRAKCALVTKYYLTHVLIKLAIRSQNDTEEIKATFST